MPDGTRKRRFCGCKAKRDYYAASRWRRFNQLWGLLQCPDPLKMQRVLEAIARWEMKQSRLAAA